MNRPNTRPDVSGSSPKALRVSLIDDDTALREGLPYVLPGVRFVGVCRNTHEFLTVGPQPGEVDVVLLDLNLNLNQGGLSNGPQGRRAVQVAAAAGYRILIYTGERRRAVLAGCYLAGARGIVHKTDSINRLYEGIERVAAGQTIVTPAVAGLLDTIAAAGRIRPLTQRQADVLAGRARGETYAAIGRRLHISPRTAEEYMQDVIVKFRGLLETHTPAELERQLGLAPGDLME